MQFLLYKIHGFLTIYKFKHQSATVQGQAKQIYGPKKYPLSLKYNF